MKMAKKFLAVALAGVLALSVLTGCGDSVKSKDIADSLTKMGVKVEQSKDVDKTAENTLKAIETIIAADSANKITLDNAVEKVTGKVKLKLYKGNIIKAGIWSPNSLYSEEIATFGASDFDQTDAGGFIELFGLPTKVQAIVDGR